MFNFSCHTFSKILTICKVIQPDGDFLSNDKIMLFTRLKFHVKEIEKKFKKKMKSMNIKLAFTGTSGLIQI